MQTTKADRGTPEDGRTKRPKQTGQLSYARVAQEGFRAAIVCEDYPENQISRENFVDILLYLPTRLIPVLYLQVGN